MRSFWSLPLLVSCLLLIVNLGHADHLKHQTANYEDELRNKIEEKLESKKPISDTAELFNEEALTAESSHKHQQEGPEVVYMEEPENSDDNVTTEATSTCYRRLVRLVGGRNNNEGRLEVLYNRRWGTVCGRGFSLSDANVACKQLGFTRAMAVQHRASQLYGTSRAPIYMDNLKCRGTEPSLFHCGHRGIGVHSCTHSQDVGIICYKSGYHTLCDRRYTGNYRICLHRAQYNSKLRQVCGGVLVRYNNKYGTICNDHADRRDAMVICRQLGYRRGARGSAYTCGTRCGGRGRPIWLNNLGCRGSETSITRCPVSAWSRHNCGHNEDIGVCCKL